MTRIVSIDCRWKIQRSILSCVQDQAQLTALPPADYALRFLRFVHTHLFTSAKIHPPGIHQKNPPASTAGTRVVGYGTSSHVSCPRDVDSPEATAVSSRNIESEVMMGIAATVTNVSFYDHPSPDSRDHDIYRRDSPASVHSAPDTLV